ncbi:MAG: sigma-70 family RNA polymerase sigma factor [Acidimicrobiales bacterium]
MGVNLRDPSAVTKAVNGGAGSAETFEETFSRLFPRAFRLARRILGDAASAEDVAAEALARAYAQWPRVEALAYRDGWILKVTTNLAIDRLRRHPPDQPVPAELLAEDALVLRLALTAALRSLPRRQRQAVALRYLGEMSEAEVAKTLDVSVGAVKTHTHRGLVALRAKLGDDMGEVIPVGLER